MKALYLLSTGTISPTLNNISSMLRRLVATSAVHFWWPEKFENVSNSDLRDIKNLQNLGIFLLTSASICKISNVDNKNKHQSIIINGYILYLRYIYTQLMYSGT